MSYTTIINVRTESRVKREVQAIAEKLGLSLSALINAYLKQLARTKTIHFSLLEDNPSEYLLEMLAESKKDIKRSKVSPKFNNADEAIRWLKKKNRRYAN